MRTTQHTARTLLLLGAVVPLALAGCSSGSGTVTGSASSSGSGSGAGGSGLAGKSITLVTGVKSDPFYITMTCAAQTEDRKSVV